MDPNDKVEPTTTPEQDALAAMDAALAGEALPDVEPTPDPLPDEPKPDAEPKADDKPADPSKDGEATPDDKKVEEPKEEAKTDEPDAKVEEEITGLGLKQKAAERFRELSAEVRELAPLRAEMEKLGVKDVAGLQAISARAAERDELIHMVTETGATGEQFGQALDYMRLINSGNVDKAIELLTGELQALCKVSGKAMPGVFDPLQGHPDLLEEVESDGMSRARAEELAGARNRDAALAEGRKAQAATQQQAAAQEAALAQATQAGKDAITALGRQLEQADPHYAAKHATLVPLIQQIAKQYPPNEWALRAELAYAKIPNPAAKPPVATGSPVRSGPPITPTVVPVFDDPMEAMNFALEPVAR